MSVFQSARGDWTQFRRLEPPPREVDFHYSERGRREIPYWEAMDRVRQTALEELKRAYSQGEKWLIFTHGASTSGGWNQPTARSKVRGLMRSTEATPYIIRKNCWQHETVFVAAIRPHAEPDRGD